MPSLKKYLLNLNLFKPPIDSGEREDEHQRHSNIIASRIYLVVLALTLLILDVYLWLSSQTRIITVHHPSKDEYERLPLDVQCSCSRISIPYGEFTSVNASFHQVCSSVFITDRWIEAINFGSNSTYFYYTDFRTHGSAQFQSLAAFCRLSKTSVVQSIVSFRMSILLSPQVLSKRALQLQTNTSVNQFQQTAPNTFKNQLQVIREMTLANRLFSGLETNILPIYSVDYTDLDYQIHPTANHFTLLNGSLCDCRTDLECISPAGIYNIFARLVQTEGGYTDDELQMSIPGILVGCIPVGSALYSTLECFYNQTCLDELIGFLPTTEKFPAMNVTEQSYYEINSTIKALVDRLMVEEWINNVSYEKYYAQCAPLSCTYSQTNRNTFVFVIAKLVGLLGGLTVVLGIIIPTLVHFIKRPRNAESTPRIPLTIRLHQSKTSLKKIVIELNIFKHYPSNDRQVRYQRYATRLYIILILISLIVLSSYSLLIKQVHQETVFNVTEFQYIPLEEMYPNSLSCPCSSISISYGTFITIQPKYHQVCSSDFISSKWISYTKTQFGIDASQTWNYAVQSAGAFLLLATFCEQIKQTIGDALEIFFQTQFVGARIIPHQLLESQGNELIINLRSTTTNQYLRTIELFRATNQGNQLMNDFTSTDWIVDGYTGEITLVPKIYSSCSCGLSQSCRSPMGVFAVDPVANEWKLHPVPNFFVGCLPIEGLLASTLECFYNRSCLLFLDPYMSFPLGDAFNFSVLDANRSSPYETIESMINRLLIDSWPSNISFSSYYNACAPLSCTYEYNGRNDIFVVVATIIGIFGGLSLGYKLLILILLRLIEKLINGVSYHALMQTIKSLLHCPNEHQMIDRLHFILVMMSLIAFYMLSAFTPQPLTVEVQIPSLLIYQNLAKQFSDSLQCPCSQLSIRYESFFSIEPRFHQICSSKFVSREWIEYLYGDGNLTYEYTLDDYRYTASNQFQGLALLCQLSQKTVNDSLSQLVIHYFIDTQLLSFNLLNERIRTFVNDFQITMPYLFLSALSIIRETTGANMIMNALSTSWKFSTSDLAVFGGSAHTVPNVYGNCSCSTSSKCVVPSRGMLTGCYPLEALLQSTLRCFYDQQCIDSTETFKAMNPLLMNSSRFDANTTIETVINQLTVEEYLTNTSYEKYFNQCAPLSCTYSYIDQYNFIEGITTLIGLYGGLVIISRVIAVIIVNLFRHRTRRIIPTID